MLSKLVYEGDKWSWSRWSRSRQKTARSPRVITGWTGFSNLGVVRVPDTSPKRLAHAKAHADGDAHDQQADEHLYDDAVPLAEVGEAVAGAAVPLGSFCLAAPVLLARPHLALGTSAGALRRHIVVLRVGGYDGLDVGVEGVGLMGCGGGRDCRRTPGLLG